MPSKEDIIAIPADPNDPEDRDVSVAGLERGLMGREIRMLRHRLGLNQAEFADAYRIPLSDIRDHEIGRTMPAPAVLAYLKAIAQEPEVIARALAKAV